MGVKYNTGIAKPNLVGLMLDATNPKSFSPNVFPNPIDPYAWFVGSNGSCTIARDTTTTKSPAGGIPLKMSITGNDPYMATYNGSQYHLAPAASGETWTVSVWVKASTATTGEIFIFGDTTAGAAVFTLMDYSAGTVNITTEWTRVSYSRTFTNASTQKIQVRLDGTNSGGTGIDIWWDGVQVERTSSASTFNPTRNTNGTNWWDLSPNKCHGTMYGNLPLTIDTVPCFDFAGVTGASTASASLGFTFATNPVTLTGGFTFSTWIKNPPVTNSQIGLFGNAGGANGFRFGVALGSVYVLSSGSDGSGYSEPNINFTSSLSASLWYNVVTVFDRSGVNAAGTPQWQVYVNGVLQTTTNMTAPQTVAMSSGAPGIVRNPAGGLYTGKLAQFMVHNTPLSAEDVLQNFNAYRGRFGV